MLVFEKFLENIGKYPDKTLLVTNEGRYSYRDIGRMVDGLKNGLLDIGMRKGDRIIVYSDDSLSSVVSIYGIMKMGGIFIVVNPQIKGKKLEFILNDSGARAMIVDRERLDVIRGIEQKTDLEHLIYHGDEHSFEDQRIVDFAGLLKSRDHTDHPMPIDVDLAALIYTSGSTGFPKAVMLTHRNIISAMNSIIEYLKNDPSDIILNLLPLSFDYGLYQVLMTFHFGGTIVIERSFVYPSSIFELIEKEKVTGFPIVPTLGRIITRKKIDASRFNDLRYITNTAQNLPEELIRKLREQFPDVEIFSMYGLTECKRVSYLPPELIDLKPTSVGIAMPNTEVFIVDDDGNRIDEPFVEGQLVVKGSNVMVGYWNNAEATEKILKIGDHLGERHLYTGDIFKKDEEGFLYFIGRKDDILKVSGEKVSPKEIENVLYDHPGIHEVAVIGIEDDIRGNDIVAIMSVEENIDKDRIWEFCKNNLEKLSIPKQIEIIDVLPKNENGKIDKKRLKEEYINSK